MESSTVKKILVNPARVFCYRELLRHASQTGALWGASGELLSNIWSIQPLGPDNLGKLRLIRDRWGIWNAPHIKALAPKEETIADQVVSGVRDHLA